MLKPTISSISPDVHCVSGLGSNWIILQDGQSCTLVDCGYPRDLPGLDYSLSTLGLSLSAVEAVLVTHGHSDHLGTLRHLISKYRIPVFASAQELPNIAGTKRSQVTIEEVQKHLDDPLVANWMDHAVHVAHGLTDVTTSEVSSLESEEALDLPGSPRPVATPGHTPGHTAYFLDQYGVLISGDSLVTGHPTSRQGGLQMLHAMFHGEKELAEIQLLNLASLPVAHIAPGHGPAMRITSDEIERLAATLSTL